MSEHGSNNKGIHIVGGPFDLSEESDSLPPPHHQSSPLMTAFPCSTQSSPRGGGLQHSSSTSLIGGIRLLVDLYWLTWLAMWVLMGLI